MFNVVDDVLLWKYVSKLYYFILLHRLRIEIANFYCLWNNLIRLKSSIELFPTSRDKKKKSRIYLREFYRRENKRFSSSNKIRFYLPILNVQHTFTIFKCTFINWKKNFFINVNNFNLIFFFFYFTLRSLIRFLRAFLVIFKLQQLKQALFYMFFFLRIQQFSLSYRSIFFFF